MLNQISLQGRLTQDPEKKQFPSGDTYCQFSLACQRDYKDKQTGENPVDFFNCVTWKHNANFLSQYAQKGDTILISGSLQQDKWTDKNGESRSTVKINCTNVYILGRRQNENQVSAQQNNSYSQPNGYGQPNGYSQPNGYGQGDYYGTNR